jgi:hypothetical protein
MNLLYNKAFSHDAQKLPTEVAEMFTDIAGTTGI